MDEFEQLYKQHAGAVLRYAWRCVGRRDIAEELAADAFVELFRHFDRIDASQLPAWLFTVVRHRSIDYWRRKELENQYISGQNPETDGAADPAMDGLLDCAGLKPAHRLCLSLRYVHGMSREEIAEFTGLRETQVKGYLKYGLSILKRALEQKRD